MKLGVNIDHIATLRQIRKGIEPEPVVAAGIAEMAGADSIVIHLREDKRHIQDRDLEILRKTVKTKLNLEMSCAKEIVDIACKIKPDQVTLVPERREEITTEGGLDVIANRKKVKETIKKLKSKGVKLSLFVDPDKKQIEAAKQVGADSIELHTGRYAEAKNEKEKERYLKELKDAAVYAREIGLKLAAGHGLNYFNVKPVAKIKGIEELNIGYSIVCRAVLVGLEKAIKEMKELIE